MASNKVVIKSLVNGEVFMEVPTLVGTDLMNRNLKGGRLLRAKFVAHSFPGFGLAWSTFRPNNQSPSKRCR